MSKTRQRMNGAEGGALPWVLLACAVVGIAFFLLRKPTPPAPPPVIVIATPIPATPPPATPAPVVVATPTPMPVVVATPTPAPATPPPLDLATVVRTPGLWPPAVTLVQPTAFPLMLNGRVVGESKAPAGLTLRSHRVHGQSVEVEYQNARHFIPIASTDLMPRALATFRQNGSVLPVAAVAAVAPTSTPPPMAAAATPPPNAAPSARVGERIGVEVVRNRRSRIEGGDFDDKKERIEMRVKLTNTDTKLAAEKFKGEIFVFAESILDRNALKVLNAENFDFSLPPRGTHEFTTAEVETMYDTTGARFGYRYDGWVVRLRDGAGNIALIKSSSPTLQRMVEKAPALTKDKSYDRATFQEKAAPAR